MDSLALIPEKRKQALLHAFAVEARPALSNSTEIPSKRGVYGIFVQTSVAGNLDAPQYLRELAQLSLPVYIGKVEKGSLRSRLSTHAASIECARNLKLCWFEASAVPLADVESCPAGEIIVISSYGRAPWQGTGFGNKAPGRERTTQRVSQWDKMHPGRERGEQGLDEINRRKQADQIHAEWRTKIKKMSAYNGQP